MIGGVLYLGYYAYMESSRGRTFGKQIMKLRVHGASGGNPTMEEAFRRNAWAALGIISGIPVLGWIFGLVELAAVIAIAVTISQRPAQARLARQVRATPASPRRAEQLRKNRPTSRSGRSCVCSLRPMTEIPPPGSSAPGEPPQDPTRQAPILPPPPPLQQAPPAPYGDGPAEKTDAAGFLRALFDFGFSTFITPKVVRFVYMLATALIAVGWLFGSSPASPRQRPSGCSCSSSARSWRWSTSRSSG